MNEELHLVVPGTNAAKGGVEHGLVDAEIVPPPVADSRHLKLDVALVAAGHHHWSAGIERLQGGQSARKIKNTMVVQICLFLHPSLT